MKCSRCGSRYPNRACYVCREDEPEIETPDQEGTALLKSSITYLCLVIATCTLMLCFVSVIIFAAFKMPTHAIAALTLAGFFGFAAALCNHDLD
jgi:hypothetical protein